MANGIFSEKGLPIIKIKVRGTSGDVQEFEAIVDTGDNGYLLLPLSSAFSLGLILVGIDPNNVGANDKKFPTLIATGEICLEGKTWTRVSINLLENGTKVLIGNSLLKVLKKKLIVDFVNSKIEITDGLVEDIV